VVVDSHSGSVAALPIDGITDARLAAFRQLCAPVQLHVVITASRARALGLDATAPVGLAFADGANAATLMSLVAEVHLRPPTDIVSAGANAVAAIELAKIAHRLPALLVADVTTVAANMGPLMRVGAEAVLQFRRMAIDSLAVAAEADIPLNGALSTRFVIFRDAIGGSSTAVIVGEPDCSHPVPLRLHSACLTGDVFGSRRCDCGDQLRMSLSRLDDEGGGIILYLEQEGRGLGLANKMRAYKLQDDGLDTLDANTMLGFDDDEREYGVAVRMLQILGCTRVKLLTNNPAKLDWLTKAGIEVCGRIPLHGPVNADNRRYLTAKATRAGHKLDNLMMEPVNSSTPAE
jgi:GTP cyclohydrolase II